MGANGWKKHGHTTATTVSPTYSSWKGMLTRCYNKNLPYYRLYGGRGICVCKKWHEFKNFLKDMGVRPPGKYSLDRIDNNGNYEPSNCRWATTVEQAQNTRRNKFLTYKGITVCKAEWARRLGIAHSTLRDVLNYHGTIAKYVASKKKRIKRFTYKGKTKTVPEWAKLLGVTVDGLHKQIQKLGSITKYIESKRNT
jgi:hypothetical protein